MATMSNMTEPKTIPNKLSMGQERVYNYISSTISQTGKSPSLPEIARRFGYKSHNAAADHVRSLIKKGYLKRRAKGERESLKIIGANFNPIQKIIGAKKDEQGNLQVRDGKVRVSMFFKKRDSDKYSVTEIWMSKADLLIEWEKLRAKIFEDYAVENKKKPILHPGLDIFYEAMWRMERWINTASAIKKQFSGNEWRRIEEIRNYVEKYYPLIRQLSRVADPYYFTDKLWEFRIVNVPDIDMAFPANKLRQDIPQYARRAVNALLNATKSISDSGYKEITKEWEEDYKIRKGKLEPVARKRIHEYFNKLRTKRGNN